MKAILLALILTSLRASKFDCSLGTGIYMLPSNINLSIGKTVRYNNKTLISNSDMKIDSKKDTIKAP